MIFAAYFILKGHDTHINFLQLFFMVGINKQHFGMRKSRALPTLSSSLRETAVKIISIWVFFYLQ